MSVSARDPNLDPVDWRSLRAQSHRMVDDMIDYVAGIRDRPVWQTMNPAVRAVFHADLPQDPTDLSQVYQDFQKYVLPYAVGNVHPGFMGWVTGGRSHGDLANAESTTVPCGYRRPGDIRSPRNLGNPSGPVPPIHGHRSIHRYWVRCEMVLRQSAHGR